MKSICVAMFPDLYVMRWLSRFLRHMFPRSRSNARVYSRILSPSTSGSGLPYPIPIWFSYFSTRQAKSMAQSDLCPSGDQEVMGSVTAGLVIFFH